MIFNIHFQWSFLENQLREKQKQICHHYIISMIYPLTDHFSPQPITGQAITSKIGICNPLEGHWFLSSQLFCSKTECEIWQGFCSLWNLLGLKWHTVFFIIVMRTAVVSGLKQGKKNHMIILVWNRVRVSEWMQPAQLLDFSLGVTSSPSLPLPPISPRPEIRVFLHVPVLSMAIDSGPTICPSNNLFALLKLLLISSGPSNFRALWKLHSNGKRHVKEQRSQWLSKTTCHH